MRRKWKLVAVLAIIVVGAACVAVVQTYYGVTDAASESVRYTLKSIGQSIYGYHAQTGQWPSNPDDLNRTTLLLRLRYWRVVVDNRSVVIAWRHDLNADPAANAGKLLLYHNRGLLAMMGRHWVCWGDLRTEYVTDRQLKQALSEVPK
jgi:hypothetical protein